MNEVTKFTNSEFGSVRTIMLENEPYFVGKDVAEILGYTNPSKAISDHVDEEDKLNNDSLLSLGQRGGWLINESGLYSLILSSKMPNAKKFKRWVTHDVLPEIRKSGSYHAPKSPMELLEMHYNALKEVNGKTDRLAKEFEDFKEQMPLLGEELTEINLAVKEKVIECLGGKESGAYQNKNLQRRLYRDVYGHANRSIGVRCYKSVKRNQLAVYIGIVKGYQPTINIQSEIDLANSQEKLKI